MSIKTEIERIKANIAAAYTALSGKGGTLPSAKTSANLANAIKSIPLGTDTSDATAAAGDILSGKTAYVNGTKVTGTIVSKTSTSLTASGATVTVPAGYYASQATKSVTTATQATPSISVSAAGLITASATQTAGYVAAGTKSATKQLTAQAAQTITPGTSDQTIASGRYLTGAQTVKGDANLIAPNIKSGVSIFGVDGTFEGDPEPGEEPALYRLTVVNNSNSTAHLLYAAGQSPAYSAINAGESFTVQTAGLAAVTTKPPKPSKPDGQPVEDEEDGPVEDEEDEPVDDEEDIKKLPSLLSATAFVVTADKTYTITET